jgi:CRP-like cAMP-binding protein
MDFSQIYNHDSFTEKDLEQIKKSHVRHEFKKGDYLLKEEQISTEYFCIERGILRSYAFNYNGDEITTNFFSADEIAIEPISLFLQTETKEYLQCLTDVVCWKLPIQNFQELFHTVPNFSNWGRMWMTHALLHSKQRTHSILTASAKERYLTFQKSNPIFIKNVPLKFIASYLGITDSTLSKIRKEITKPI